MTREEQLDFCRKCKNRKFDNEQGIICRLTDAKADFEDECPSFELDPYVKDKNHDPQLEAPSHEIIKNLSNQSLDIFKPYQDFSSAIFGGSLVAFIGALLWAVITVATEYQIGFMAIGIGLLVGHSVRYFGAGVDQKFGILGAILALVSCLLGNLFAQIGFVAQAEGISFLLALKLFDYSLVPEIYAQTFGVMDILFYGIAIGEGYKFAFRSISKDDLSEIKAGSFNPEPSGYNVRKIVVGISIVVFGALLFLINQGAEGEVTFKYEDGSVMSQGEYESGKEHGLWKYWYPSGKLQLEANFDNGTPHGPWNWYFESGSPSSINNYYKGMLHGFNANYHFTGVLSDSGRYVNGRLQGPWAYYTESGRLMVKGSFERDYQQGKWVTFYENGQKSTEGSYLEGDKTGPWNYWAENGQKISELFHEKNNNQYLNSWNKDGVQVVKNGEGTYSEYHENGKVSLQGEVKNKRPSGTWTFYYENGDKMEEGVFENNTYRVINTWKTDGKMGVKDGNGLYEKFDGSGYLAIEKGTITDGLRTGTWENINESTGEVSVQVNYVNGKLEGPYFEYSEDASLVTKGTMKDNERHGEWVWMYDTGEVECTVTYEKGKKQGEQPFYNHAGEVMRVEIYKDGQLIEEKVH
ncbi:MAG: hypothetical protein HWE21_02675 [Cytophagia bacterium]|nr:hypothetical protein [Cytophagia bacterium]